MAVNYHIVFAISCVFTSIRAADVVFPCTTPNGEAAYCTSLFACLPLMQSIGSQEPTAINFVKKSICLGCEAGDFMVCCGSRGNYSDLAITTLQPPATRITTSMKQNQESTKNGIRRRVLPSRRYCGYQQTDDRFYNSTTTALDEFPWLVHISSDRFENDSGDKCSGVIINHRYVLTDAYCGAKAELVSVGLYNIRLNVSCLEYANVQECTDPTQDIKVESRIRSGEEKDGPYGFMLLRLAQKIIYTDYVRPICLPVNGSKRRQNTLTYSGWGAKGGPENIIKKRLFYGIANNKVCYDIDKGLNENVKSANVTLICLTPDENNVDLTCNEEHGGPLMYSYSHQWFAEGVVLKAYAAAPEGTYSAYSNSCSNKDPISGILITPKHMSWILESVED